MLKVSFCLLLLIITSYSQMTYNDINNYRMPSFSKIEKKIKKKYAARGWVLPLRLITPVLTYSPIGGTNNLYFGLTFNLVPTIDASRDNKADKIKDLQEVFVLYTQVLSDIEIIKENEKEYNNVLVRIKNADDLTKQIELGNQKISLKKNIMTKHKEIVANIYLLVTLAGYKVRGTLLYRHFTFKEILNNVRKRQ